MLVVTEDSSSTPLLGPIVYWTKLPIVFLIWEDPAQRSCPISNGWTVPQLFPPPACEVWAPGADFAFRPWSVFFTHPTLLTFFQYFIYFMLHVWFPPNLNTFSAAWVAPKYCCNVLEPHSKHSGCFRTSFLLIQCLKTIRITMPKKQEVALKSPLSLRLQNMHDHLLVSFGVSLVMLNLVSQTPKEWICKALHPIPCLMNAVLWSGVQGETAVHFLDTLLGESPLTNT